MNFSTKMDQSRSGSENEPFAKRRKSNSEGYENETVVAFDQEQTSDIFKLDLDCFQEAFDYLRFEELDALAGTCKWLHEVAGHCYRYNYSEAIPAFTSRDTVISRGRKFENLIQFTRYAKMDSQKGFHNFLNYQSRCLQLTSLELVQIKITRSQLDGMKEVLTKINLLRMNTCEIGEDLHDILALTPNLKHLHITNYRADPNIGSEWLVRKYPTLERFEFVLEKNESVISFLELNSNIRTFGTTLENLWENRQLMKVAKVKLDDLAIKIYRATSEITRTFELHCQLLNELHELGIYKRLKVYGHINQKMVGHMTSLNALVKLQPKSYEKIISLSSLSNLEEILLDRSDRIEDLTAIANNLKNLEKISFCEASISDIIPFISQAAKLKEIYIKKLSIKNETDVCIDLSSLNSEREKLPNAKKVTIYVNESVYLNVKWKKQQTDIGLVKLKRNNRNDWKHDFLLYI